MGILTLLENSKIPAFLENRKILKKFKVEMF